MVVQCGGPKKVSPHIYLMLLYFQSSGVVCNLLSFRHLKQGIQEFHRNYVLVPADKAANNYINTLKQELNGTKAYKETSIDE